MRKLYAKGFSCKKDAFEAVEDIFKGIHFHALHNLDLLESKSYPSQGRPNRRKRCEIHYHIEAGISEKKEMKQKAIEQRSCYVIGTTIPANALVEREVIMAYNQSATVERGFRFLKDPILFASSFFVKKPERIMGLLMVMTFALLVYSIAQRRLRKALKEKGEFVPDQIKRPTAKPTLRWIFQLLEGIEIIKLKVEDQIYETVTGLDDLRIKIIEYFGSTISKIYKLEKESALLVESF